MEDAIYCIAARGCSTALFAASAALLSLYARNRNFLPSAGTDRHLRVRLLESCYELE